MYVARRGVTVAELSETLKWRNTSLSSETGFASVFWYHQVAEKALKALLLAFGKAVRGHNLLELIRLVKTELKVEPPREVERCARKLNPHYIVSRYPDAANGLPYEIYEREDALEALNCAEVVLGWVRRLLQ